jgi:hypothetical protein
MFHLNVNSFRYKFTECCQFLYDSLADLCIFTETKLDDTYPSSQFHIPNFSIYRKDRNSFGGGILIYVNSILPQCIRHDFDNLFTGNIEGLVIEIVIKKKKWLIVAMYKPPNVNDSLFTSCFTNVYENLLSETPYVLTAGDLNFNMNHDNSLLECCNILGLKNLVVGDTCFKSNVPTSIDVILTSNHYMFVNESINVDTGISDFHNLVGCVFKAFVPQRIYKKVQYRSFRKFNETDFLHDLSLIDFNVCTFNTNVDDSFRSYNDMFSTILDKHAPMKQRVTRKNPPPFMNHELRSAIYKKCMLRNKFYKDIELIL